MASTGWPQGVDALVRKDRDRFGWFRRFWRWANHDSSWNPPQFLPDVKVRGSRTRIALALATRRWRADSKSAVVTGAWVSGDRVVEAREERVEEMRQRFGRVVELARRVR